MNISHLPFCLFLIGLATLALSAWAADSETPPPQAVVSQAELAAVDGGEAPPIELSPMMVEIESVLERARQNLAQLEQRAANLEDAGAFLAIQRQIEQLQVDTELQILQVQADHHRRAGHLEAAERIEASIARAREPRPARMPIERPAPDGSQR